MMLIVFGYVLLTKLSFRILFLFSITCTPVTGRGGRSHFFQIRLRTCSIIFESGSGNFSNLTIRLLFIFRLPLIEPKFTHVFT